jgi:AcrR family transcriptional regulator
VARLSRSESQARTRKQLIDAATVVFARRGFRGASIEDVAEQAGYSKGAVYSNFRSKDALFLAVLETRLQERVEFYRSLARHAEAWPGQDFAALLPRLDEPGEETWCLLQVEFWLYAMRHPPVRRRMAVLYRQFRAHLAPLVVPYTVAGVEPAEIVAAVMALYHSLTLQWHSDPSAIRPDLVTRILRGLGRRPGRGGSDQPVRRDAGEKRRKR